ncbi:MAG: type VI secretion system contractile sheath small subunit [Deltaproteobacteria bacterium]|jgi:type VI secretion system protein ImpB|nr:type VI secretion system contractile sheath small subunit [Deltaproteobacteria bacterium]
MPKETSVAPKERVNIVYKPATGDAKAEVELPNKLLVVGDFTGQPDERQVEDRDPISIDKDNFEDVMKGQGLKLDMSVQNKLADDPEGRMAVHLDIDTLKDFSPEAVAQAVPELKQLLELREALKTLKGPLANVPDFRRKIQEIVKDDSARAKLTEALGIDKDKPAE